MNHWLNLVLASCSLIVVLIAGCGDASPGGQSPGDPPPVSREFPRTDVFTPVPFTEGEQLVTGDYGIDRAGDSLTPTLTVQSIGCRAPDLLQIDTRDDSYVVQMRTFAQWTCPQALDQARQAAGRDPNGMRVGLTYREPPRNGEAGQVNVIWENGSSLLLMTEGVFRGA